MPAIKFGVENCNDGLGKTNGSTIFINYEEAKRLSSDVFYALLLHELLHCFLFHTTRMKDKDLSVWNTACDFVVNDIIIQLSEDYNKKLTLPEGALYDKKYRNWSAEQVYNDLKKKMSSSSDGKSKRKLPGDGEGKTDSDQAAKKLKSGWGNAPSDLLPAEEDFSEDDLRQDIEQAAKNTNKKFGNVAGIAERIVKDIRREQIPWERIFNILLKRILYYGKGRSFARPKPYGWLYNVALPGNIGEDKLDIVIILDTSGSVNEEKMDMFIAELKKIVSAHTRVRVITCDCKVQETVKIRNISDIFNKGKLKFKGGGGTNFEPALKAASKIPNDLVIYITDGIGKFGKRQRIHNLIWVLTNDVVVPYGKKVFLEAA